MLESVSANFGKCSFVVEDHVFAVMSRDLLVYVSGGHLSSFKRTYGGRGGAQGFLVVGEGGFYFSWRFPTVQ